MRASKNKKIYEKVANNTNVSPQVVKDIYESMFRFIKERLREVDNLGQLSEEEMEKLRLSFNLPMLGKFFISYESIQNLKKQKEYYNEHYKNKEN